MWLVGNQPPPVSGPAPSIRPSQKAASETTATLPITTRKVMTLPSGTGKRVSQPRNRHSNAVLSRPIQSSSSAVCARWL